MLLQHINKITGLPAFQNGVVFISLCGAGFFFRQGIRSEYIRAGWKKLSQSRLAVISLFIVCAYFLVALADSVVWRESGTGQVISLLDAGLSRLRKAHEKTYSAPFASAQFTGETVFEDGIVQRVKPPLMHPRRHIFGTDGIGEDVFYVSLKSVRTAVIIGGFTTLIAIPFALFFGILAGFYGGIIDDIVQYIYTTMASIPDVLLIVAFMLFSGRGLFQLCLILGITSWIGLCRLVRAETLKLREMDYVAAARSMGVPGLSIMKRHILLNLSHIVIIVFVLRFSGLVLSEAVLSYIGIGVGSDSYSWGNMINLARQELSRDPVVWWPLLSAFLMMFVLVVSVNILGDRVRDALDPRFENIS